ncbi:MAG: Holliday junction branch migration protein RuvA [Clostridia bacterium]|nr:Holliday junction branch migration protein RuvA [Clostridia bacterium]
MYAFINGTIEETDAAGVVIQTGGIGYLLQCPAGVMNTVKVGQTVKLYTYQAVREDAITLYGFLTRQDRTMFLRLVSVSGIGPKIALQVLSSLSAGELAIALVSGDASALTHVPGIGKKTAQRLILELREKVDNDELTHGITPPSAGATPASSIMNDAVYALAALGYSTQEASRAAEAVSADCKTTEEIIRAVLKSFDRR